ncbi:MAG: hypothetical protein K6U75_12085 [Firmicutes bacterium]|nr:hypothetical protein [Bacillota bacterium]
MVRRHHWRQVVCCVILTYLCLAPPALSQRLIWLGTLGGSESEAYAVSDNGIVVGQASTGYGGYNAFRWVDGVMQNLNVAGNGSAHGCSPDGSVVVGRSTDRGAFRWTAPGGVQYLGGLGASDVCADGSVVCGWAYFGASRRAFLWTADTGLQELGSLGGGDSVARGISADGAVVVGDSNRSDFRRHAFRWTGDAGMQDLGTLGGLESCAYDVSADGSVVVGSASRAGSASPRAFRWTASGGMQDLGTLGGSQSVARAVSANGEVVVGDSQPVGASWSRAFGWTQSGGMENLNTSYAALLTPGSHLGVAYGISPNGRFIVGKGWNAETRRNEAFLLDTGLRTFRIWGRIELRDFVGDVTQVPIGMELRQGGVPVRTETIFLNADGNYTIPDVENGTYDLAFKASHWLRTVVAGVQVSDMDVSGVDVSLTNGDVDGDNEVTLFDFGALVAAFGSVPGDGNWNPDADFDGDEEVTLFDFGILVGNFGAVGDE